MVSNSKTVNYPSINWLRIALAGSLITLAMHCVVLLLSGQNPIQTPISQLSRSEWGWLQSVGLICFGGAHVALAIALGKLDHGRLWPYGRLLLVASGAVLFYLAYYFVVSTDSALQSADANDPLWVVASLTGTAMGVLQPGLARQYRGLGLFSIVCLGLWLWLIPLLLLVNESWLGAYERLVGIVYLTWMIGVTLGMLKSRQQTDGLSGVIHR